MVTDNGVGVRCMLQLCQCLGGALHISSATGTWPAADGQPPAASAGVPGPSAHEASCTSAQNPAWRRTLGREGCAQTSPPPALLARTAPPQKLQPTLSERSHSLLGGTGGSWVLAEVGGVTDQLNRPPKAGQLECQVRVFCQQRHPLPLQGL